MPDVNADDLPVEDSPTTDARPLLVDDIAGTPQLVLGPHRNSDPIMIVRLETISGTPARAFVDVTTRYWSMPDGSTSILGGGTRIPTGWSKINVYAVVWNESAVAGNVVLRLDYDLTGEGAVVTPVAGSNTTRGLPAVAKQTTHLSMLTNLNVTAGKMLGVALRRVGASGSDTLTSAMALRGILLERVA